MGQSDKARPMSNFCPITNSLLFFTCGLILELWKCGIVSQITGSPSSVSELRVVQWRHLDSMTRTTRIRRFSQYQERMCGRHSAKSFSENVVTEKVIKILKSCIIFRPRKSLNPLQ